MTTYAIIGIACLIISAFTVPKLIKDIRSLFDKDSEIRWSIRHRDWTGSKRKALEDRDGK